MLHVNKFVITMPLVKEYLHDSAGVRHAWRPFGTGPHEVMYMSEMSLHSQQRLYIVVVHFVYRFVNVVNMQFLKQLSVCFAGGAMPRVLRMEL